MVPSGSISSRLREIPAGVWTLGFVSMLMDISSEMIHALLPIYMISVLGTSTLAVGFIEGIAEATASITKIFSGALSDWLGRRKELAALGYGLAASVIAGELWDIVGPKGAFLAGAIFAAVSVAALWVRRSGERHCAR